MREADRRGRGRPRAFCENTALTAAMELFWRQGFHGTSMDDLVAATHASRAGLYAAFGAKADLFAASVGAYAGALERRVDEAIATASTGKKAVALVLRASAERLADRHAPPGCLRCRSTFEAAGLPEVASAAVARANANYLEQMRRLSDRCLPTCPPAERHELAAYLTTVVNGMAVMGEAGADRQTLDAVIDVALRALPDP